jgi:hypothetical protein
LDFAQDAAVELTAAIRQESKEGVTFVVNALLARRSAGGSSSLRIGEAHAQARSGKCLERGSKGKKRQQLIATAKR